MKFFIVTFPHSMRYPMIFSEFTLCLYTTEKWRFCFPSCTSVNESPVFYSTSFTSRKGCFGGLSFFLPPLYTLYHLNKPTEFTHAVYKRTQ